MNELALSTAIHRPRTPQKPRRRHAVGLTVGCLLRFSPANPSPSHLLCILLGLQVLQLPCSSPAFAPQNSLSTGHPNQRFGSEIAFHLSVVSPFFKNQMTNSFGPGVSTISLHSHFMAKPSCNADTRNVIKFASHQFNSRLNQHVK